MKLLKPGTVLTIFTMLSLSCSQYQQKYPYSISDFPASLQPYLIQQTNIGVLKQGSAYLYIIDSVPKEYLLKLALSEIPILRATALEALFHRPGIDTLDIIKNHLDDTARVMLAKKDRETYQWMVSDYMLRFGFKAISVRSRADSLERDILLNHNYLDYAYDLLYSIKGLTEYYPAIREMAFRKKPFSQTGRALLALAEYKRPEDIVQIASLLSAPDNNKQMDQYSLELLGDFPCEAYWGVLKEYYDETAKYYTGIMDKCGTHPNTIIAFYGSLGAYKNPGSASILGEILARDTKFSQQASMFLQEDKEYLLHLMERDSCSAYLPLLAKYRKGMYWIGQGLGK